MAEVDGAVGAEHDVVGRIQPLCHVFVDQHSLLLGGEVDAENGACARSGGDETAASQDQAVGTGLAKVGGPSYSVGVITRILQPDRTALCRRPFDDVVDLGVGGQQVAVSATNPNRPFCMQEAVADLFHFGVGVNERVEAGIKPVNLASLRVGRLEVRGRSPEHWAGHRLGRRRRCRRRGWSAGDLGQGGGRDGGNEGCEQAATRNLVRHGCVLTLLFAIGANPKWRLRRSQCHSYLKFGGGSRNVARKWNSLASAATCTLKCSRKSIFDRRRQREIVSAMNPQQSYENSED